MPTHPDQKPTQRRSGGGGGYFFLAIVVAGVFAAVVFAPDSLRSAFGIKAKPASEGDSPQVTSAVKTGDGSDRGDAASVTFEPRKLAAAPVKTAAATPTVTTSTATATRVQFADEAKATQILTEAKTSYAAMQWRAAESAAKRVAGLDCSPLTKIRANDIATNAPLIETLFKKLPEPDELSRNWETNPGVVRLIGTGVPSLAVPLEGDTSPPVAVEENPLAFIEKMRTRGTIYFMIEGKRDFIKSGLDDDKIGKVEAVDVPGLIKQRASALDDMVIRIRNSERASDPTAWYEAGKFAFRNRIDGKVTDLLDRAVTLNSNLVTAVREEKAGLLSAAMMIHLKNGNQSLAAVYVPIIRKRYLDTEEGKQAIAMYDGKKDELLALAKAADAKRLADEAERRRILDEKAKAKEAAGDTEGAAVLKRDAKPEDEPAAPTGPAADGDEAKADAMKEDLRKQLSQAVQMPATEARNKIYHDGVKVADKIIALYTAVQKAGKGTSALEEKTVEARKMRFLCTKSMTL